MRKALLVLVFLSLAALEAQEIQKPVIYQSRPSFYHDTPQGTIAFVPASKREGDVARMTTFKAFEDHGHYNLTRQGNYGFAINIWDPSKKDPSFLAITIIQALTPEDSDNASINLQRSANWGRDGQADFPGGAVEYTFYPDAVSFSDFVTWNSSCSSIAEFEEAISQHAQRKIFWHGKPVGGKTTSWEVRKSLFGKLASEGVGNCLHRWFSDLPPDIPLRVSTRLVRFTPSDNRVPRAPMDFYFQFSGASHVAIMVFCPDYSEYNRTAFLTLQ
jgi:hypothetical protein